MKVFIYLLLILSMVTFVSCGKEDEENIDNATSDEGGRCRINADSDVHLCVEYPNSTLATDATDNCENDVYIGNYDSMGSSRGYSYEAGKNLDCSTSGLLGTCSNNTLTTGTGHYYSDGSHWNATTAEADCTGTLGGTWTAN